MALAPARGEWFKAAARKRGEETAAVQHCHPASYPPLVALIEDDAATAAVIQELLETAGYRWVAAHSLPTALAMLEREQPDLLILDLVLHGVPIGWWLLDQLGRDPRTAAIRVIVCSADTGALRAHEDVLRQRGVQILPKPFDIDELEQLVASAAATPAHPAPYPSPYAVPQPVASC
jgi:CheY-like chemotaxis protein